MTLTTCDASIIVDTKTSAEDWCVYEQSAVLNPGEPPTVILIGASKLVDLFRLVDGKVNSEWCKLFENGGKVLVRIIATTSEKQEAYRYASERVRSMSPQPRCNLHGYSLRGTRRSVICLNNKRRYDTQRDAAFDLGIHASAISRHLNGELAHAQGFKFAWAPSEDIAGQRAE